MARKSSQPETPAPAKPVNLGALGDRIYAMGAEIAAADKVAEDLRKQRDMLENQLIAGMDEIGSDIVRGDLATVSISESEVPQLQDFDQFAAFVIKRKALHLLQRRIAVTAYRELRDLLGKPIPGVAEFKKRSLNVRKVT